MKFLLLSLFIQSNQIQNFQWRWCSSMQFPLKKNTHETNYSNPLNEKMKRSSHSVCNRQRFSGEQQLHIFICDVWEMLLYSRSLTHYFKICHIDKSGAVAYTAHNTTPSASQTKYVHTYMNISYDDKLLTTSIWIHSNRNERWTTEQINALHNLIYKSIG